MPHPLSALLGKLARTALAASPALLAASLALGATVDVSPGGDIQAALDAAAPGDVVRLLNGVHPMPAALVMRNGVALVGESRDAAILDGGQTIFDLPPVENGILFSELTDSRTRVSNLTITGAHGTRGGAFAVLNSAGEISHNRIVRNYAANSGTAIDTLGDGTDANFLIAFNLIHHNSDSVGDNSHAIDVRGTSGPTIQNNTFSLNDDNGVFAVSTSAYPQLINNIFFRNGTDHPPAVVLDPETGEPISGTETNVGRGTCYFSEDPIPDTPISHNLFFGNQRSAVLVQGASAGDYEDPRDLEALESFIAGSQYYPRGVSDDVLFVDVAGEDFRILHDSLAAGNGDPSIASSQGVDYIGAEAPVPAPVPALSRSGPALLVVALATLAGGALRRFAQEPRR